MRRVREALPMAILLLLVLLQESWTSNLLDDAVLRANESQI